MDLSMSSLSQVRQRVVLACQRSHRDSNSVRILAVSKLQPIEKIQELIGQGQQDFGENYVQELTQKMANLASENVRWHLIGHLQKNKIKHVLGHCDLIHSVDSTELAKALSSRSGDLKKPQRILLQVNVGGESSKEGFSPDDLVACFKEIKSLPGLSINGLMTMPPLQNSPDQNRPFFKMMAALRDKLSQNEAHPLPELSMGTSHDFEVAIEEGATIIRVGTILFGDRPPQGSL